MSTLISALVAQARNHLNETVAGFWSDSELVFLANRGIRDLWRNINDDYQDYFLTVDITNCSLAANTELVSGVPADVGIIRGIEPRVRANFPQLVFFARDYMHADFANARARDAIDPSQGGQIFWHATGAGAPVGAPSLRTAPLVTGAVPLRLVYIPTLVDKALTDPNPIPGESDQAIIAWIVAYALGKQQDGTSSAPDAGWLAVYKAEKTSVLVSLAPRQTEDEDVAEALFEPYW